MTVKTGKDDDADEVKVPQKDKSKTKNVSNE